MPIAFFFLFAARLGLTPVAALRPTCLTADTNSTHYSERIGQVVSDSDSTALLPRTRLRLPQLAPSRISLVTGSRDCRNASTALDAAQGETNTSRRLYVFKLGNTRYGVIDLPAFSPPTTDVTDESVSVWFFDSKWSFLGALSL